MMPVPMKVAPEFAITLALPRVPLITREPAAVMVLL